MYPAVSVLRSAGLDPDEVAARLGLQALGAVSIRPAPRALRWMWGEGTAAMALPWGVYVRADLLFGDPGRLGPLLLHELTHLRQWRQLGVIRFLGRYVGQYLRGRFGGLDHRGAYLAISLEREARAAAGEA